jgi:PTS system nitrogen regulatory IIA component
MQLNSIPSPGRTLCGVPGTSKKRVLENIAQVISEDFPTLNPNELFDHLVARERLGSIGLGHGIAIPHCRIPNCDQILGTLIKLEQAVDFDAIDANPVDLLFVLLVPEQAHDEHLKVLATVAEMFNDKSFCQQLRAADNSETLYSLAASC